MNQTPDNTNQTTRRPPTRAQRWLMYGTNVAVLLIAVLAIVVLINWIAVRNAEHLYLDLTASRMYSLSDQTMKVLDGVDSDIRIVTVFPDTGLLAPNESKKIVDFRDLIDVYKLRGGGRVNVEHVDAGDIEGIERLASEVTQLHEAQLADADEALAGAIEVFGELERLGRQQSAYLVQRLPALRNSGAQIVQAVQYRADYLADLGTQLELDATVARVRRLNDQMLPDYQQAIDRVRQVLQAALDNMIDPLINAAGELDDESFDEGLRETFVTVRKAMTPARQRVKQAIERLDAVDVADYAAVRSSMRSANTVLVMIDDAVTTVELAEVYTDPVAAEDGRTTEQRFRGEEAVTGAIISLTLEHAPLVVFVNASPQAMIERGGPFGHVADRLRKMDFQVVEWFCSGRQTQFGPMPAQPRPEPAPGQALVNIFIAQPGFSPGMFKLHEQMNKAIDQGEAALIAVARADLAMPNPEDPIQRIEREFGLAIEPTRWVLTRRVGQDGNVYPVNTLRTTRWTDQHIIARALAGRSVEARGAIQMDLAEDAPDGVERHVLLRTPEKTWGEKDWRTQTTMPEHNPQTERSGPFALAIAAERDDQRLVVFADSQLASNNMITQQQLLMTDRGLEPIERVVNPGNAELFVNSVFWLAGVDELIGAGARSQDVRRVGVVGDDQRVAVWWVLLAALPGLCLLGGGAVWLFRRR
jgi:hypothetical protein